MIANYWVYLNALPNEEKMRQIFILVFFFGILLVICCLLKFLKLKFTNKNQNSLFQNFFKEI